MTATDTEDLLDSAAYRALDFEFDPAVSAQVLAETVDTMSQGNPTYRHVVEKELSARDIPAEFRDTFGPLGLRHDNLADTMAAYWLAMWSVIHGKPLASDTQARAVRRQVLPRIQGSDLAKSARKRQMMGEAFIYEATIGLAVYLDAKANQQELQLRQLARNAKKNTKKKGIDLAHMKLTDQGLRGR